MTPSPNLRKGLATLKTCVNSRREDLAARLRRSKGKLSEDEHWLGNGDIIDEELLCNRMEHAEDCEQTSETLGPKEKRIIEPLKELRGGTQKLVGNKGECVSERLLSLCSVLINYRSC